MELYIPIWKYIVKELYVDINNFAAYQFEESHKDSSKSKFFPTLSRSNGFLHFLLENPEARFAVITVCTIYFVLKILSIHSIHIGPG